MTQRLAAAHGRSYDSDQNEVCQHDYETPYAECAEARIQAAEAERDAARAALKEYRWGALQWQLSQHQMVTGLYGGGLACSCGDSWPCKDRDALLLALHDEQEPGT